MRPLRADEIEVRIGTVGEKGVSMLLYKNARTDMAILDEMYGTMNWQKDYKEIKGNLYCGIGVWDADKAQWVWKWDCGTESFTEKEKGEASDAFTRAGFNVGGGIGRELYTAPFIWLPVATVPIPNTNPTRYRLNNPKELNGIYVSKINTEEINGRLKIKELELSQKAQGRTGVVYHWAERSSK